MSTIELSIVTPAYNAAATISRQLASLRAQVDPTGTGRAARTAQRCPAI